MLARVPYQCCPLCESSSIQIIAKGNCSNHPLYSSRIDPVILWNQCAACEHVFTEGYFNDAALAVIFSKSNEQQNVGHDIERQRYISAEIVEKVLPYAAEGKWLDVGFGNGSLLFTADEYGFTAVGLDLRKTNVDAAQQIGLEAILADITALPESGSYSVISMCDVLEHMPFPLEGLAAAARLLKTSGVLFLSMPNMDSFLWRLMSASNANPYWGELEHYHNFGRRRLFALLAQQGFKVMRFGISKRYRACMEIVAIKDD